MLCYTFVTDPYRYNVWFSNTLSRALPSPKAQVYILVGLSTTTAKKIMNIDYFFMNKNVTNYSVLQFVNELSEENRIYGLPIF